MTFNLAPQANITNLFRSNGISRKHNLQIEWVFVLYFGIYGMYTMNLFLTNQELSPFCGYPIGNTLDPYAVISPADGAYACHVYCVQSFRNGYTGFIKLVWLALTTGYNVDA
jgi:hypothetical protein